MLLSYVKLFFLSGKRTFYYPYLIYIVYIDFFDHSSLCFFLFLSMLQQSCTSFYRYSTVGDSTKDILDQANILFSLLSFGHLDQSYVFSLTTFKIQRKSRNVLKLYSMYPFYESYTAFWKSNLCQINKNNFYFYFFNLNFFQTHLKVQCSINCGFEGSYNRT